MVYRQFSSINDFSFNFINLKTNSLSHSFKTQWLLDSPIKFEVFSFDTGEFQLFVSYKGENIRNSPYRITIKGQEINLSKTVLITPISPTYAKNKIYNIVLQTFDKNNNIFMSGGYLFTLKISGIATVSFSLFNRKILEVLI